VITDALSADQLALAVAFISGHHAVTLHTPLADVVVACVCTPGVQRNAAEWAEHLLDAFYAIDTTSGAGLPGASVDDRPAPVEEAGAGRVIPFPTK
jgi:hypothetical protein